MCKFIISLCICCLLSTYVSAATIVRHEHTVGASASNNATTSDNNKPSEKENNSDEVLVVYGPFKEPAFEVQKNDDIVTSKEMGGTRVDKFLGDYVGKNNPGFRRGQRDGIDYIDSIYLLGKDNSKEDYVIAIRKQLDHPT